MRRISYEKVVEDVEQSGCAGESIPIKVVGDSNLACGIWTVHHINEITTAVALPLMGSALVFPLF
jgi:hypothetical protein